MGDARSISVIVPTLNEEAGIGDTLLALRYALEGMVMPGNPVKLEIIVSDGGSTDRTRDVAAGLAHKVVESARGRGVQMNAGAGAASGDVFLFLHADCHLPSGAYTRVCEALSDDAVSAGAFDLRIGHEGIWARVVEWVANRRSRLTRVPYGDQGLFMRAVTFRAIGGYKPIPLMEDVEIALRLKKLGRIVFLKEQITASPRRWMKEGVVRATIRDWALMVAYLVFRVPPEKLLRHYSDTR